MTASLHIAVVTETYPPEVNGVAMTLGRMVRGLLANGHRISLPRPRHGEDIAAHDASAELIRHGDKGLLADSSFTLVPD